MKKITDHNSEELITGTVELLELITVFVNKNEKYNIKGDINFNIKSLKVLINDLGINDKKRLKRFINNAALKQTLFSINRFLWFINKVILENKLPVNINEPRHETIQAYRKKWKKSQKIADELLAQYKDEKSDYYKQ